MYMNRTLAKDVYAHIDQEILLKGWVDNRRDMGKMVFIDLKDRTGVLQCTMLPNVSAQAQAVAAEIRTQYVIEVTGTVVKRPEKMVNAEKQLGDVELLISSIRIINTSLTPLFPLETDGTEIKEELRLEYRYLDMRRERLRRNIIVRSYVFNMIRDIMRSMEFLEVDTPTITKGTPEGAREYIMPARNKPGHFYVLPQSPQQFKQLLMVGGIERYFQIARCYRDEDVRADRHQEFTQLDIEMSFVTQQDVIDTTEKIVKTLIENIQNYQCTHTDWPEWKAFVAHPPQLQSKEFPVMTFAESMAQFGTDKPDLRSNPQDPHELAFCWIVDIPLFEYSEHEGKLVSAHHPFTSPNPEDIDKLDTDPRSVRSLSYDLVLNGYEVGGGSIRIHDPVLQKKIFTLLGISEEEQQIQFGHLLKAFEYGVPPHGGIAPGLDRLLMALLNETSIREVIPFPKTGDGNDLLMGAPSPLPKHRLDEVHIQSINA